MSLEKAIKSGKEHRAPYRKSLRSDKSCRNNGGCPYCEENRLHNNYARMVVADTEIKQVKDYGYEERTEE